MHIYIYIYITYRDVVRPPLPLRYGGGVVYNIYIYKYYIYIHYIYTIYVYITFI